MDNVSRCPEVPLRVVNDELVLSEPFTLFDVGGSDSIPRGVDEAAELTHLVERFAPRRRHP
ncbi:MAG: hypothetical protein ABJA98_29755 [Acidobacteriota bacterium]